MEEYRDITDKYEFIEDGLLEQDGPVAGFLRNSSGEFFVFDVVTLLGGHVSVWVLVPVAEGLVGGDPSDTMDEAEAGAPFWISIVEDRREPIPVMRELRMDGRVVHRVG